MKPAISSLPADWIANRLNPGQRAVGWFIPSGYEAYVRIMHPLVLVTEVSSMRVKWRDVAVANGSSLEELLMSLSLSGEPPRERPSGEDLWSTTSDNGTLTLELASTLLTVLEKHTETLDKCWFAVWDGWTGMIKPETAPPVFRIPWRELLLFEGQMKDILYLFAPDRYQSANLWWPDDRRWCVSTDIDFNWTYVGATQTCIDDFLANSPFEAYQITTSTVK